MTLTELPDHTVTLECGPHRLKLGWKQARCCIEEANSSPGYGVLEVTQRIVLSTEGRCIPWELRIQL